MTPKIDILSAEEQEITAVNLDSKLQSLFQVVGKLSDSEVYMIGSSVRKHITHETNGFNDYDFIGIYNFDAIESSTLCEVISRHDKYGVMKVRIDGCEVDLIHNTSVMDAISSRDITLSLLCMDSNGRIFDPLGYFIDFESKVVRIEDSKNKVVKDPVRIVRVLRFAIELGFEIEPDTLKSCIAHADLLRGGTAKFEVPKIRKLDPDRRKAFLELAYDLGIGDQVMSVFRNKGVEIIKSNEEFRRHVDRLIDFLGFSNFYIYGGSLRDSVLERDIGDIDAKLTMSPNDFIEILRQKGYEETENYHLPEGYFFYNRRFNAISVRLDDMVYDFTFIHDLDLDEWYRNCDVNCNALMMNVATGNVLNSQILDKIMLGVLELCDPDQEEMDPLKFTNYLKQIAKTKGLILDQKSVDAMAMNMPRIYEYFKDNPRMLYRIKSIIGRDNSAQAIDIIRTLPGGQALLGLMEG